MNHVETAASAVPAGRSPPVPEHKHRAITRCSEKKKGHQQDFVDSPWYLFQIERSVERAL
jgi:hypothetical protein